MSGTYESIILLHDDEAREAIALLGEQGEDAAFDHLKQWYEPGEGTLISTRDDPWKPGDERHEHDKFVMYVNRATPYIGLVRRVVT